MINVLGGITALILCLIAAIHAIWGLGFTWPEKDSRSLARRVAGFKGIQAMPSPAACFAVATFLIFAAVLIVMAIGFIDPVLPMIALKLILAGLAAGFCMRGLFSFLPFWRRLTPEQPFARLDRHFYGPLCLCLALMLAGLVTQI
ncbi:DUF3995 domain-containing protein [Sneathiella marina]|uniref:DUF3995 domain-containing protein n=1 Tax=Sneathiella marina TaxID=2950108 RepID=A0ABY4W1N1_9PROT|nr:DUF3995 domain-containing protein [Sneathiella marina]USG61078.1 DUF3995 domain-containing protein [Sneathiella marina]